MSTWRLLSFILLFTLAAGACFAQGDDTADFFSRTDARFGAIGKQLDSSDPDDATLDALRAEVADDGAQAKKIADDRTPELAAVTARLSELGPAPPKGTAEAPDITAQRNALTKQSQGLEADIKRANVAVVTSGQLTEKIASSRRASFQARLSQRLSSPLSPTFWRDVGANFDGDGARLAALRDGVGTALADAVAPDNRPYAIGGFAIGLILIVFVRWRAERALMQLTADRVPHGRLRRSALALAVVAVVTVFSGVGAQVIATGLDWHQAFSQTEATLARAIVAAVCFGGFVAGLGRALLSAARPSWRLPPIADETAQRLRIFPLMFGAAVMLSILLNRINGLANASLPATIASSAVVTVLYCGLIAWALARARRTAAPVDAEGEETPARPLWIGLGLAVLGLGVAVAMTALLLGYVALAHMLARQMVWLGIVVASLYLLMHLIEDVCATGLSSRTNWARTTLGLESRVLDQFAVLCSAVFRVAVFAFAIVVALAPFGTEPSDLIARGSHFGDTFPLGKIEITPASLIGAMLVFVVGLALVRLVQRWLLDRYLPTTRLDAGMRSSVTSLLGYAGGVAVFAAALGELGVSVEKIAWVASALSVGIGFGLQAVVQNFVSGLILLIERPVKVGDWVVLDNAEGDIRRIHVRATEIQMADRSTVIVPNSELITKSVRNVTLANADGRVRLRLPLPIDSDAERVRDLIRASLAAHSGVLATPEPSVLLDAIEGGTLIFIAIAYIGNPRQTGSIRSDLLFDVLGRLRADGIALASPYDVRLRPVDADPGVA